MLNESRPRVEMPQLFERRADLVNFAGGLPDLEVLPLEAISGQVSRLVRLGGRLALQYSTPHVAKSLIPAISELMGLEGAHAEADDLVPTGGS
jgi:2-aminoadipate transaminase